MTRELIDTIIELIERKTPKEVILDITKIEEYHFNQIKERYTI